MWLLTALLLWQTPGTVACQSSGIVAPARGSTVADARPVLTWLVIPGAIRYRVEIESRVPEGRILVSLDTQVSGTRFQPPQPLTDHRAAVKVRVTAGCPPDDGGRLRDQPATFK
jgi:hypothetical protein